MRWRILLVLLSAVSGANTSFAADPRYPDWPCAQAKVPEISLAAVWAGPTIDDVADKWKSDPKVSNLAARLAARRTSLDEAEKLIAEFLSGPAAEKTERGKLLFAGLFDDLNAQRFSILNGLERVHEETARSRQRDTNRYACFAGAAGCTCPGSSQSRTAREPACLADPHLRRPSSGHPLRLRGSGRDRSTAVRARTGYSASNGVNRSVFERSTPPASLSR